MEDVFLNLIENSIRHSGCDRVKISCNDLNNKVVCSVEDDGSGVPEEYKEKVFDRSFRKGPNAGSGIGLYLARGIVENFGGKIEIGDSELGGARFDVYLKKP